MPEKVREIVLLIKMVSSGACPLYVAAADTVYDTPKEIGKKLLAMRDAAGRPVAEVASSPADIRRAVPLRLKSIRPGKGIYADS